MLEDVKPDSILEKKLSFVVDDFSSGAADEATPTGESKQTNFSQKSIFNLTLVLHLPAKSFKEIVKTNVSQN